MKTPVLSRPSVCRSSSVRCAAALRYPATASAGVAAPPVHSARGAVRPAVRGQLVQQRVLRRQHHVGGAEQRVRPGGEDLDVTRGRAEPGPRTGRPADPVALHQRHRLGPVDGVQVVDQPVRVRRDAQHPLGQRPPVDREVAPLAPPLRGDLLVRQHGAQARAPVDDRVRPVRQPVRVDDLATLHSGQLGPRAAERVGALGRLPDPRVQLRLQLGDRTRAVGSRVVPGAEDLQEDPLGPPVELDVGGGDAAAQVVAQPQPAQLPAEDPDVGLGGRPGVLSGLHRVLLGGQAERVEAHRVQHVGAGHPQVAGVHVGADVAQRVADVQPLAARVREHVHHVAARPPGDPVETLRQRAGRVGGVEGARPFPAVLPGGLDPLGQRRGVPVRRGVRRRHLRRPVDCLAHARRSSSGPDTKRAPVVHEGSPH